MDKLKQIKQVQTIEDLEALGIGRLEYEIGHRGGTLGFNGLDVLNYLGIEGRIPGKFGAHCNYLGGGIRGSVCHSAQSIPEDHPHKGVKELIALGEACKRAYINAENECGLNDDECPDGDTNWDAQATKGARKAGVESAY